MYLNQSEDQCNTNKGLEMFRQTIVRYEEGVKDDANDEDDEEFESLQSIKRQKLNPEGSAQ